MRRRHREWSGRERPPLWGDTMKAVQALERYIAKLHAAREEIEWRLATKGADEATFEFDQAKYAGVNDVVVQEEEVDGHAAVVARGDAVAFIEFGTGVVYNGPGNGVYPQERPEGIVGIGEYGKGHGASNYGWYYRGEPGNAGAQAVRYKKDGSEVSRPGWVHTYGNLPASGMYRAANLMSDEAGEVVREVLAE